MRALLPALALLALALAPGPQALAHDYSELAPLQPELRAVLVRTLEGAAEAGHFEAGEADPAGSEPETVLTSAIGALDRSERAWLIDRLRRETGLGEALDQPDNVYLPLFYDLADFVRLYRTHGHGPDGDAAAEADFERLQALIAQIRSAP